MASAITVVIPTHNRRETVVLALETALGQTRPPDRVIVVADGCTDGTPDAVRALGDARVEVLDLPKGPGRGYTHRNEALRRAGDGVVAWLCDDDLWFPDHLERIGEVFDANAADLVTVPACVVHDDDRLEASWADWGLDFYRDRFLRDGENRTPSSAVAHRAPLGLQVGGWRDLPTAADMDLWQRILQGRARAVALCSPTLLHFRAWRRAQPYPELVSQISGFAERLRDPDACGLLRAAVSRAVHTRISEFEQWARHAEEVSRLAREKLEQRLGEVSEPGRQT